MRSWEWERDYFTISVRPEHIKLIFLFPCINYDYQSHQWYHIAKSNNQISILLSLNLSAVFSTVFLKNFLSFALRILLSFGYPSITMSFGRVCSFLWSPDHSSGLGIRLWNLVFLFQHYILRWHFLVSWKESLFVCWWFLNLYL